MEFKYKSDLYPKVALIKAAYHFTDEFYVHLDEKDGYYVVVNGKLFSIDLGK